MLRLSANLGFLWKGLPLVEGVGRAKAAGFDAVEFHFPYEVPAATMRAAIDAAGLPVVGLNTRLGNVEAGDFGLAALPGRGAEARAAIDEALVYGKAIGAGYVHVLAGKPDESRASEARSAFLQSLDYAAKGAAAAGMTIVIEPLNRRDVPGCFLHTTDLAEAIIAELGRPNVKILFDCYNIQVSQGDLTKRLERLMPLIGHIQIAAVPSRAEPDEGEVATSGCSRRIAAMGYEGFIGAEYRARGEVEAGLSWIDAVRRAT